MFKAALRFGSILLALIGFITPALPIYAATTSVPCDVTSLIDAMNAAIATTANDTLDLAAGCTYTLTAVDNTNGADTVGVGLPTIPSTATAGSLTLNGNGATVIRDSSAPDFRILSVNSGGNLIINDLTISGGHAFGGGGILNFGGTLSITRSTISGNAADSNGGGVGNSGTMTVLDSTFYGNTAGTSTPNSGAGGGITSGEGALWVINSTFYGNSASSAGGAILAGAASTGTVTIVNSTITANSSIYSGGAVYDQQVPLTLYNTIIAGNTVGGDCVNNGGTITASHTLIEDSTNNCGLTDGIDGNIVGDDPTLSATATGSPAYFSLLTGSPAIDAGDNALAVDASSNPLTVDEAGNARIYNGTVDLGAVEFFVSATHLAFVQQPTDAMVSTTISPAVTVAIEDAANAVVTSATDAITLAIGTNPGGGTLSGTLTVNAVNGVATFSDLSIDAVGNGYTITASASSLTEATSDPFDVTSLPPPPSTEQTIVSGTSVSSLCARMTSSSDGAVTLSGGVQNVTLNGVVGNTYCRLIAVDSQYITSAAEIGVPSVINLGVVDAVDVFGQLPAGETVVPFVSPVTVCLRGSGDVLFLNAADVGRAAQRLASTVSGAYTCVSVPNSGTVVLVGQASNLPASQSSDTRSAAASTALANCRVTTLNAPLNLRAEPSLSAKVIAQLPYNLTLTATAYTPGWYQVIYLDGQGWLSAQYLSTAGDCAG